MNRLKLVMPYTADIAEMKLFYRDAVGLPLANDGQFFAQFEGDGDTSLALLAVTPAQRLEIELCFESADIEADVRDLAARGVEFIDKIRALEFGKVVHFRDPEGTLISLLQPALVPALVGAGGGGGDDRPSGGSAASRNLPRADASGPRLTTAIVNARDLDATRAFYRDRLGLALQIDSPGWVSFDARGATLALHPRVDSPGAERHHGQGLTIGFAVPDLVEWADEARGRGVHFTTAPTDQGWGMFADALDPEGNEITFREPARTLSLEDELVEAYEDDAAPQHAAIRRPLKKGARAVSRVAVKPAYKAVAAPKQAAKKAAKKVAKSPKKKPRVHSTRGAGPAGTRLKPKRSADPKRARNRPATGRMKKAEARSVTRKKGAVARASKSKPVKRAMANRGRKR